LFLFQPLLHLGGMRDEVIWTHRRMRPIPWCKNTALAIRKLLVWYNIQCKRFTTAMATSQRASVATIVEAPEAASGLAIVRVTIGAMLVWVFFENLGKGLYTPGGYAGLIQYYIQHGHSPAVWKAVMGVVASHAAMAAPGQALTEISLGILLVIGLFTRPVAFIAFLYLGSLWVSEWGTAWIWELLVPVLASLGVAIGRAGRRWGVDAYLAQRFPSSPWW
jgi:uncharacterized membrane protein YphA (DoxX/SURF4 family)